MAGHVRPPNLRPNEVLARDDPVWHAAMHPIREEAVAVQRGYAARTEAVAY